MFDHIQETNFESKPSVPDSATKEPPVRVNVGGKLHWIRPSNVLRIESHKGGRAYSCDVVIVILNDGERLMWANASPKVADEIAALLWPQK